MYTCCKTSAQLLHGCSSATPIRPLCESSFWTLKGYTKRLAVVAEQWARCKQSRRSRRLHAPARVPTAGAHCPPPGGMQSRPTCSTRTFIDAIKLLENRWTTQKAPKVIWANGSIAGPHLPLYMYLSRCYKFGIKISRECSGRYICFS